MEDFSVKDYWLIAKRWRKLFIMTSVLLFVPVFIFSLTWSNYRSTATVEVKSPDISINFSMSSNQSSNPENFVDLRLSKIRNEITSTETLAGLVQKFGLYEGSRNYKTLDELAAKMRSKIQLTLIGSTVANALSRHKVSANELSAIAFTLSFDDSDPQKAKLVADELVSLFLESDLKRRRSETQKTVSFLEAQLEAFEKNMADQEKAIAEFQASHGDVRPEALAFNQHAATSVGFNLQNIEAQLAANEGKRGSLLSQLVSTDPYSRVLDDGRVMTTPTAQLKALEAKYASLTGRYGAQHPDVVRTQNQLKALRKQVQGESEEATPQITGLNAKIEDVKTRLQKAKATYSNDNPKVISLKKKLASLEESMAAVKADQAIETIIKKDADNPNYIQIVTQLRTADAQRQALLAQRDALAKQHEKYQMAIAENPLVEQQMSGLTRDLVNSKQMYNSLKEKKLSADMEAQLDRDQGGQRLVVINPPTLPTSTEPSRLKIILGGLIFAVMGGAGAVLLAQLTNQTIMGSRHLTSIIGIAPLSVIPHLSTQEETKVNAERRKAMIRSSLVLAVLAALLLASALMPFDVLWTLTLQRLGIL